MTSGVTHPGVCEPMDSPQCQGRSDWVDCNVEVFSDCDNLKHPEIRSFDAVLPVTAVPGTRTNYFCITFDLPSDQDYHIVAFEPLIDNAEVMHHIDLLACKDDNYEIPSPQTCGISSTWGSMSGACTDIICAWSVGMAGRCLPENLGYRFGASGLKRIRLELHWNNANMRTDMTDGSGLRLYYRPSTPELKDLSTFYVGQRLLRIPPGQERVEQPATCSGSCTRYIFTKPAFITSTYHHMHYFGHRMSIEIWRDGQLANSLSDDFYSYDNPVEFVQNPVVQILPGDEIRTMCVYKSLSTKRYTFVGEGTQYEMCMGYITIYPKDAINPTLNKLKPDTCIAIGPVDQCALETRSPVKTPAGLCDWAAFINSSLPETQAWMSRVHGDCSIGMCRPECAITLSHIFKKPCMHRDMRPFIEMMLSEKSNDFVGLPPVTVESVSLLAKLNSCPNQGLILDLKQKKTYMYTFD